MLAVEEIVSCLVFARLLAHLHPELFPHPLVHPGCITYQYQDKTGGDATEVSPVGDADRGADLAEVGEEAAVEAAQPLHPPGVAQQAEAVGLLVRQRQLGPEAGLALQLRPDQGERVGSELTATRTEVTHF